MKIRFITLPFVVENNAMGENSGAKLKHGEKVNTNSVKISVKN